MTHRFAPLLAVLALVACGQRIDIHDGGTPEDAGTTDDGGSTDAGGTPSDGGTSEDGGTGSDAGTDGGAGGPTERIRFVTANLSTGNSQEYEVYGTRILQGLKPDIALIQEFNISATWASDRAWVDDAFGAEFHFFRETQAEDQLPNGIVSRHPILQGGEWTQTHTGAGENRDYVWARINIPGPVDLWAISVHLKASSSDADLRAVEAAELANLIETNVPAGDYVLIGADLNTSSRTEAAVTNLSGVVVTAAPYPVDQAGDGDTNASRASPYDWVLADPALDALEVPVVIGSNTFQDGLVFDSRVYTPLSDVPPVQQTDSGAVNMQHMAVVRDFAVPTQ